MLNFIWEALVSWLQELIFSALDLISFDMLYAFSPSLITMDSYFPFLENTWELMCDISFGLILFLCVFKLVQNFFLVFSKNYESPMTIIMRTILAFTIVTCLPTFVYYLFKYADIAYWGMIEAGNMTAPETPGMWSGIGHMLGNMFDVIANTGPDVRNYIEALPGNGTIDFTLYTPIDAAVSLVPAVLSLIMTIAIAWNYFKLVLEIAERYIVLGVMYYTMPLAAVPIVSKETSQITKSWLRMLISELMILVLNIWFIMAFRMAVTSSGATTHFEVNGHLTGGGLIWTFVALAFLKTAQRIDSHIASLGLTTAQLGAGLSGSVFGAATGLAAIATGRFKGIPSPAALGGRLMGGTERNAIKNLSRAAKGGGPITNGKDIRALSPEMAMAAVKDKNLKLKGDAAKEYAKKLAPEQLKGKNITDAVADKNGFKVNYKDANGKNASLSYSETNPGGICKTTSIGNTEGFLKDTGTPYDLNDINAGDKKFNDFANEHLNGADNFIAQSGHLTPKDLENATVGAAEDGDGFVIRDKDGHELAHVTPFNDEHADGMTQNTVVGEGSDGLYRADFNSEPKMPLPEGYSYAGETYVDSNGNQVPLDDASPDAHWQNSYRTPDGTYIPASEMNSIMAANNVSNSDYAGNLNYDSEKGFTDKNGSPVEMEKTGWNKSSTDDGMYVNSYTGGKATGEQIAEHMSNPQYASQSYGGLDESGNTLHFDNCTKDKLEASDMATAPKYGEIPSDMNAYYNPSTGDFGMPESNGSAKDFGSSLEGLMDKDYTFSGEVGAKVAQTYMPNLKHEEIRSATLDKDTIVVDKYDRKSDGDTIIRERYMSNLSEKSNPGRYQQVESNGNMTWVKTYDGAGRGKGNTEYGNGNREERSGNNSNSERRDSRNSKRRRK